MRTLLVNSSTLRIEEGEEGGRRERGEGRERDKGEGGGRRGRGGRGREMERPLKKKEIPMRTSQSLASSSTLRTG
jgi:hypothetical protein